MTKQETIQLLDEQEARIKAFLDWAPEDIDISSVGKCVYSETPEIRLNRDTDLREIAGPAGVEVEKAETKRARIFRAMILGCCITTVVFKETAEAQP